MYTIYLDKKDNFKCKIKLEGASLKNAKPRLILENDNQNLIFYGKIDSYGNCDIPIEGIKGILSEQDFGQMKLEVIADDTYFNPWNDKYEIDVSKKAMVEVIQPKVKKNIKKMTITEINIPKEDAYEMLAKVLNESNINRDNILEHKTKILPIIKKHFKKCNIKYSSENVKDFLRLSK